MMKKNFMPVSIDISNQKILVIGGGDSAFKKIEILKRFNANIEVLAIEIIDEIKHLGITCFEIPYNKNFLRKYRLIYSCSNNVVLDKQIVKDANELGVLVNIHDKPEMCDYVSPAIYKSGKITIAVGSNGENVHESIRIRNSIKDFIEDKKVLKFDNK